MSDRPPLPAATSPAMALVVLGRVVARHVEATMAGAGLQVREFGVMGHVEAEPGISISELARRSGVTAQSMHATVAGLVERGLLERGPTGRGRTSHLAVSPAGREVAGRARRGLRQLDERLFADPSVDLWAATGLRPAGLARADVAVDTPLL